MPPLWQKPKYVQLYKSRKGTYTYYRRDGLRRRIEGEIGTAEWWQNYNRLHEAFDARQERPEVNPNSIADGIIHYKQSERYEVLASSTKARYEFAFNRILKDLAHVPMLAIDRFWVVTLQEKIEKKQPRTAIEVTKVLNLVFACAMDRGVIKENPAAGVKKPPRYKAQQHEAWTEEQVDTFLSCARPVWRRAVMVALYTGLRRGDLIELKREDAKSGWLQTRVRKNNSEIEIPIHPDLAAELARPLPVESLFLVPTARGQQMNKDSLSHGIQKECKRLGIIPNPPLHGLRRTAISRLIEAGCSHEHVGSITDQSERMVKYYTDRRRKKKLAAEAIAMLKPRREKS